MTRMRPIPTYEAARAYLDMCAASAQAAGRHGRKTRKVARGLAGILESEAEFVAKLTALGFSQVDIREALTQDRNVRETI